MRETAHSPNLPGRNAVAWLVRAWMIAAVSGWMAFADEEQKKSFVVPLNGVEMVWKEDASVPDGGYWRSKEPFEPKVRDIEAYCRLLTFNCRNRPFKLPEYVGFAHEEGHLVARSGLARPLVTRNSSAVRPSEPPAPAANPIQSEEAKMPPPANVPVSAVSAVERPVQERQAAPSGDMRTPADSRVPAAAQLPRENSTAVPGINEPTGSRLPNGLVSNPPFLKKGGGLSPPPLAASPNLQSSPRGTPFPSIPPKVDQKRNVPPLNPVSARAPTVVAKEVRAPTSKVGSGYAGASRGGTFHEVPPTQTEKKESSGGPLRGLFKAGGKAVEGGGNAIKRFGNFVGGAFATKEEKRQWKRDKVVQEKMPKVNEATEKAREATEKVKSR